jgi:putative transposase
MEAEWCQQTLQEAIGQHGKPEIINTDQGSQFTSAVFSEYVLNQGIRLSMDGKGRATDNAFIERLWRSVKYEKVYLNPPVDGNNLYLQLVDFMDDYNHQRRHEGIDYEIPVKLYREKALKSPLAACPGVYHIPTLYQKPLKGFWVWKYGKLLTLLPT